MVRGPFPARLFLQFVDGIAASASPRLAGAGLLELASAFYEKPVFRPQ
jgi:hypothetical protein